MSSQAPDPFEAAPKVELHLHLEGAIPLDTLWDLVERYGGDRNVPTRTALARHLNYASFSHFIETWVWMNGFVRTYEDFEHIATGVAGELSRRHVIYAEASFSPTDFARHGLTPQEIAIAIRRGVDRVDGTRVVLNCDLVRDTGRERAGATLDAVIETMADADIRGVTIGGSEQAYPPGLFVDVYRRARSAGLRLTAHAGEAAGPDSVRDALDLLGVERIGHGVRAVEDPDLMRRIVAEQIPLEVCPTSNLCTGVASSWEEHPVGTLLDMGAFVTISTDDPTFFHTTLADELREVANRFGADPRELTRRAVDASWMTADEKQATRRVVDHWWGSDPGRVCGAG